jgi:Flp pilus assembly protein TadD
VRDGLARVGLADPLSLLAEFALSSEAMRGFAEGALRNTDDNLFLEFDSPRHIGGGAALLQSNARLLASLATPPAEIVGETAPLFANAEEAVRALDAVVAAKAALARVLAQDVEFQARLAPLRAIAQGPPRYGPAQDELAYLLRLQGRAAMQQGDVGGAVAAFEEASTLAPLDWRVRVELAWALRRNGNPVDAEPPLRAALRLAPHAPPAHYELAAVLLETGRRADALSHFRAAARARPGWADPRNDLAWLLATDPGSSAAAREEAVALAESAAALSGQRDPMILDTLAVAYAGVGHPAAAETAQRALAVARDVQPDLVPKLEARSAAIGRGDLEAALRESEDVETEEATGVTPRS